MSDQVRRELLRRCLQDALASSRAVRCRRQGVERVCAESPGDCLSWAYLAILKAQLLPNLPLTASSGMMNQQALVSEWSLLAPSLERVLPALDERPGPATRRARKVAAAELPQEDVSLPREASPPRVPCRL